MRTPSHFMPDTSNGVALVTLIHLAGVSLPVNLMIMFAPSTIPWVIGGFGVALIDLVITVLAVAAFRHFVYVRPALREAAGCCPECGYDIGIERMEFGCSECGWQR